ncbi:ABC transporter substrate-binding protein [Lapillicoccus jejuensis]|uniref:Polar amino acid transport system substrate-binding protein n=1 Tax=Lapillicoccus jejuensis TaxID=402171 RepID=A0A542DYJ7_9MICO|nr:ABC transporter substrate-binding protein [Lapillicoccus jejuensis]TQJ08171.1 polar amino acid transport system substrate-binding protein [Lapillicoccus jejuensis]
MSRRPLSVAVALAATLGLAACGSNSLDTGSGSGGGGAATTGSGPTTTAAVDSALAAKLPASIKSAGVIKVGTDATYAPNEFLGGDGKTVQGMDVDLFDAVAARFGVKVEWQPASFDSIILGVTGGKYDMGISSFSITDERKKQVNMVSYYTAGTQWVTQTGNPKKVNADDACGLTIGVQKATTQQDDLTARSKKCTDAGKPAINLVVQEGQDQVTADLVGGKTVAMAADSPVALYAVKQTSGALEALGEAYDSAPYGWVVPKDQTDFAQALVDALKAADSDGSYKAALSKWGVEKGAITDFAVNP